MTKSELVRRVGELSPDLHHREVERVVNTIFEQIGAALVRGARVEIRGFGAFAVNIAMRAPAGTRERVPRSMSCAKSFPSSKPASSCTRV
jgi:integration host factor subunit beta